MSRLQFRQDVMDLFLLNKGGHVQKYCYNDFVRPDGSSGSQTWHDFINASKNYYPIQSEIDLIPLLTKKIHNDFDTIIDFGIGDNRAVINKTMPIIKSQKSLRMYSAIDTSKKELDKGVTLIKSQFDGLRTQAIQGDFYTGIKDIEGKNRLGMLLGATISNQDMLVGGDLPRGIIIERLTALKNIVKGNNNDGCLVVSIDSNPNLNMALDAYNHPAWARMMTGLMYDIQSQLKPEGDFQPSMWHYAPVIDQDNHVIQQVISPSIDQSFNIGGVDFSVKRSDQFVVTNNFKYPTHMFMEMVEEAGLTPDLPPIAANDHPMVFIEAAI